MFHCNIRHHWSTDDPIHKSDTPAASSYQYNIQRGITETAKLNTDESLGQDPETVTEDKLNTIHW